MTQTPKKKWSVQVQYTIIDGEFEYMDHFTMRSNGKDDREQAMKELAEFYAVDRDHKHEILTELRTTNTATIGCRVMKDICVLDVHTITVTVLGGVVQDISNIPVGVQVKLMDYDIDSLTVDELQVKTEPDEDGDRCIVSLWESE